MERRSVPEPAPQPSAQAATVVLETRAATRRLGRVLAAALVPGDLVVLEGDLGAGKTYLVQAIARALGVPRTIPITSPTFELVHELPGRRLPIVHADLYRLEPGASDNSPAGSRHSLDELGLLPRIGNDAVVLVEWGDRFADELGHDGLWVVLALLRGGTADSRRCTLSPRGARGAALLSRVLPRLSAEFGQGH